MLQHDHLWQALRGLNLLVLTLLLGCGVFPWLRPYRRRLLGWLLVLYFVVGGGLLLWVWLRPG